MAYPTTLDDFEPASYFGSNGGVGSKSQWAGRVGVAIEQIEARLGITNSAVVTSLDYRVRALEAGGGGGGGAPTTATYLTTTAQAGLTNEVVVGATPGGELGGTWAAPTVDALHSGSTHAAIQAAAQAAAEATAATNLSAHLTDTVDAHDASAVSVLDTAGNFSGTQVESVLAELHAAIPVGGGGTASIFDTMVSFSSLTGATDSLKLADFCTTYGGVTFKPTLVLDELRDYTFTTSQQLFDGFAMVGGGFRALDQALSAAPYPQKVRIRMTSGTGWLTFANATVIGGFISGLTMDATSSVANRMFAPNASATLQDWVFRDLSYQNGPGIMGSPSVPQGVRACVWDGFWNINNITDATNGCAFNLGGSDNRIVPTMMLIDSPTSLMDGTGCLLRLSSLSKTPVKHLYITAEQHMGINITGGNGDQMMRLSDCEIEGRNFTHPSYGCLVRVSMDATISNSWISFGMSDPASANGGEPNNRGIIHIDDGSVLVSGVTYRNASGVANSVPFIYATTGCEYLRVSNCLGSTDTTAARFKPVVKIPSSWVAGTNYDVDNSVTVVTY